MGFLWFPDFPFSVTDTIALVAAAAASSAAIATAWQAREVRRTVLEQREDRRLAYQPYLSLHLQSAQEGEVKNVGRGIALNCVVFSWAVSPVNVQAASRIMTLEAGRAEPIALWELDERAGRADGLFQPASQTNRLLIAICEDEIGNLHRFGPVTRHDIWTRNRSSGPEWTRYRHFVSDWQS